ncbi:MAG: cytochrome c biogenesis protein CcdA [bacterium]
MKKRKVFWPYFIFFFLFSLGAHAQERKNPFSVEWDDSIQKLKPGQNYELKLKFHVPEGHYLYQDKTELNFTNEADLKLVKKTLPPAKRKIDPFLKKEVEVYLHDFEVTVLFKVPASISLGRKTLEGEIRYQGCSQDFCYRPVKVPLLVPLDVAVQKAAEEKPAPIASIEAAPPSSGGSASPAAPKSIWTILSEGKVEDLLTYNPVFLLFLAFLAGLLTDLTPCVLPIIPLTLAVVGVQKKRSFSHNAGISLSLVFGIAVTYTLLGLASAFLGLKIGFLFQSRYFLGFLIFFFIFMSLSMLGFVRLELPLSVRNFLGRVGGMGYRGAFLAGLTIGFIASPCVGPLVGPLLLWVAKVQDLFWGALILLVYGLGMGTLFFIGGTFYSTLGSRLRGGRYTEVVKKVLAIFIVLPAFYYGYVLYSQASGKIVHHEGWVSSLQEGLARAKENGKPVLIDFYSDSCLPCLELDKKTFNAPTVKEALQDFVKIKIDCTLESTNCNDAVGRFEVIGWPTVLFLNKNQVVQKDLSIVGGFVGPEKMQQILSEVKKRG